MNAGYFRSRGFIAVAAASLAASVLAFILFMLVGLRAPGAGNWPRDPMEIAVVLAVVLIWAPAFALVPAAILGFFVERPKARALIGRGSGGLAVHLLSSLGAAAVLWLLLRIVVKLFNPVQHLIDPFSLALFLLIGLCSSLSWWFLVVEPGRRE